LAGRHTPIVVTKRNPALQNYTPLDFSGDAPYEFYLAPKKHVEGILFCLFCFLYYF